MCGLCVFGDFVSGVYRVGEKRYGGGEKGDVTPG